MIFAYVEVPYGWKPKRKQKYTPRPRIKLEDYPWLDGLRNGGRKLYPQLHGKSTWPTHADEEIAKKGYYVNSMMDGSVKFRTYAIAKDFETLIKNIEEKNIRLGEETSESVYTDIEHNNCVWMLIDG